MRQIFANFYTFKMCWENDVLVTNLRLSLNSNFQKLVKICQSYERISSGRFFDSYCKWVVVSRKETVSIFNSVDVGYLITKLNCTNS